MYLRIIINDGNFNDVQAFCFIVWRAKSLLWIGSMKALFTVTTRGKHKTIWMHSSSDFTLEYTPYLSYIQMHLTYSTYRKKKKKNYCQWLANDHFQHGTQASFILIMSWNSDSAHQHYSGWDIFTLGLQDYPPNAPESWKIHVILGTAFHVFKSICRSVLK